MSLSVKNMLGGSGGGASPFAWGKYAVDYENAINETSVTDGSTTYCIQGNIDSCTVYLADTYTYDKTTRTYTLVNPTQNSSITKYNTSGTYAGTAITSVKYFMINETSGAKMFYSGGSSGANYVRGYWDDSGVYIKCPSTVQVYNIYTSIVKNLYTFIEFVTDKNPLKYPNGEVHTDGFFYRYANEGLYIWNKYSIEHPFVEDYTEFKLPQAYIDNSYLPRTLVKFNGEIHALGSNNSGAYTYHYIYRNGEWVNANSSHPNAVMWSYAVDNNYIYAYSSVKAYYYDGDVWSILGDPPHTTSNSYPLIVFKNELYCVGNKMWKWEGSSWVQKKAMSNYPYYLNTIWADDETMYFIAGGTKNVYRWSVSNNDWVSYATVPQYSNYVSIFYEDGVVYLADTSGRKIYKSVDKGATWTDMAYPSTTREIGKGLVKLENSFYFGDGTQLGYIDTVYEPFDKIISENENAYPDKAVQDGYYYERSKSGIPLDYFGCTEFELYEFTRTSDTQLNSIKIPCTLGFPKFVSVYAENVPTLPKTYSIYYLTSWNKDGTSNVNAFIGYVNYGSTSYNGNLSTFYYTDGVIFSDTNYFFQSGVNYKVVFGK